MLQLSLTGLDGHAPLRLEVPELTSDAVNLRVTGIPGLRFVVQTSNDLVNWTELATGSVTADGAVVRDANPAQFQKRFYRLMHVP